MRQMLIDGRVILHPFIIGELACGNLKNRADFLQLLSEMPCATKTPK
jgi:hypothetical protein